MWSFLSRLFGLPFSPRLRLKTITLALILIAWWVTTLVFIEPIEVTEEVSYNPGLFILFLGLTFFVLSIRFWDPVKVDEIAVLLFFEKPIDETGSGPVFAPLFFVQVRTIRVHIRQQEFPTEPELIFRPKEGESEQAPKNMKPPLRITFNEAQSKEKAKDLLGTTAPADHPEKEDLDQDLQNEFTYYRWQEYDQFKRPVRQHTFEVDAPSDGLAFRVTAEISMVVRWRVVRGKGTDFIVNIGTDDNLEKQIEDEMVGILQRLLPNMSVGQALQNIALINAILHHKVQARTQEWGVEVVSAYLKLISFNHALNSAIAERSESYFAGRGQKEILIQTGEGKARAAHDLEKAILEARAAGYKSISVAIDVSGAQAQAAEVARAVGEGEGTVVVGDTGFGALMGLGASVLGNKKDNSRGDDNQSKSEDEQ